MTENICRYSGDREQAIVSYLYGDAATADAADAAPSRSTSRRARAAAPSSPRSGRARVARTLGAARACRLRTPIRGVRLQADDSGCSRMPPAAIRQPVPHVMAGARFPRGRRRPRRCCSSAWRPGSRTSTCGTTPKAFACGPAGRARLRRVARAAVAAGRGAVARGADGARAAAARRPAPPRQRADGSAATAEHRAHAWP